MTDEEIQSALKKLQYQVSVLGQAIDYERYPVEALILSKDWDEDDLNKAHDIFEKWDEKLEKGDKIGHASFEADFTNEMNIGYQGLKSIVLAFYRNGQWTNVCEAYVDSFEGKASIEFREIANRKR